MKAPLLALAILAAPLGGCAGGPGNARLELDVDPAAFTWGTATAIRIANTGGGPLPAPIRVEFASTNGTVVRTIPDVRLGRDLPPDGSVTVQWNGSSDRGGLVLWGAYVVTAHAGGKTARAHLTILEPPTFGITVDVAPREAGPGTARAILVNNTGNQVLAGRLEVAAGRSGHDLYRAAARVELRPGSGWTFHWDGRAQNGTIPAPGVYGVGARLQPTEPRGALTATDWFRIT